MTRKRRNFEIVSPAPPEVPEPPRPRRGPMATAVRETADAKDARASAEAAARAENDRLAEAHVAAKRAGLIIEQVPLDAVHTTKLRRDRAAGNEALDDLIASVRDLGLSNPIRVEPDGAGGYELIQGWRRLSAFRALWEETGDAQWQTIPAALLPRGEELEISYRRMVDENLVRKDISFAEMATLARDYAADPLIPCPDLDTAVDGLYAATSKQKRSYIRAFAELLDLTEDLLLYPQEIPRALGLAVRRQITLGNPGLRDLRDALRRRPERDATEELRLLRGFAGGDGEALADPLPSGAARKAPAKAIAPVTRFSVDTATGPIRLTATGDKITLSAPAAFRDTDPDTLARATEAFLKVMRGD